MANFGLCTRWHVESYSEGHAQLCKTLQRGDIVQIKHPDNSLTWAICTRVAPEPEVVHRARQGEPARYLIRRKPLADLARGCHVRINNARDVVSDPKMVDDIVCSAIHAVGGDDVHPATDNISDTVFVECMRYSTTDIRNRLDAKHRSRWFTVAELPTFYWLLRKGDMVAFSRTGFCHWAVCVEDPHQQDGTDQVLVHRIRKPAGARSIRRGNFEAAAQGGQFRINNKWDDRYPVRVLEDICKFAIDAIQSVALGDYNLFKNNCWNFVMQARYGIYLNRNERLVSEWHSSSEDLRLWLKEGDIIEFKSMDDGGMEHKDWAIYMGTDRNRHEEPQVAYRYRSHDRRTRPWIGIGYMNDFFSQVTSNREFRICNEMDDTQTPRAIRDIIRFVAMLKEGISLAWSATLVEGLARISFVLPDTDREPKHVLELNIPMYLWKSKLKIIAIRAPPSAELL